MLRFSAIRASKIVTMKGRSNHRLQNSDPLEDWNNGSWTVDCVCGVNFDDGEEMVNCDECGVWVHTRCSRYVKGDDIFVCDKCKGKNNRNDSEETEVAQLLVELPTKTMGMERRFASNGPSRRPFRLWTDIPIEERVHVQGIPGGNPALFRGLSSVFTPELWKCSGYVPKRFNFQYKEFPCWEEKVQGDCKKDEENENPDDKGAGVLFSLSKQSVLATPMTSLDVMRGKDGDTNCDSKLSLNGGKKWEGQSEGFKHMQNVVKERSLLKPIVLHSGKHKKEDMVTSKDRSGKKKRTLDNEVDLKKRISHSSKAVFSPSTDAKRMELCEDRGTEFCRAGSQSTKSKNLRETVVQEPVSDVHLLVVKSHGNPENKLAGHDLSGAICSSEINKNKHLDGDVSKGGNIHVPVPSRAESSPKTDVPVSSPLLETKVALRKLKGDGKDTENSDGGVGELGRTSLKHPGEDLASTAPELEENHILQDFNGDITLNSALPDAKMMVEEPQGNSMSPLNFQSSHGELKDLGSGHTCKNSGRSDVAASSWQSGDRKAHELKTNSEAISDYHTNKADELCDSPCEFKKDLDVSVGSMALYRSSLGLENGSGFSDGQLRYSRTVISTRALPSQDNTKCVGKSSPTSSPFVKSKASTPDKSMSTDTQNPDATAKWLTADASASYSKELTSKDIVRDEERGEMPRKKAKDPQKAYLNSAPRSLYAGRMSQDSASIRSLFDSKDSLNISSKASSAHNISGALGSGESTGSLQNQKTLPSQNKISGSGGPQKAEKFNEINFQPLSKVNQNHMPTMNPPALAKSHMLSDEELALLLHQQLNSSPRVPRVPRVRQAGTLPQLSSPNAVSMLKRSSGSGGKDHSSAYRRRNKHGSKDAFRSSRELDDEVKRTEKVSSSTARQELAYSADASTNRDDIGSPTRVHAVKKNISSASTATASSGRSSSADANDRNLSLTNNSPRSASDDDTDTVGDPVHHTLPGLINEIMSKGRRMTYEELCNAVLPHWHNLRKHNGERYAYSSHSQAVLDCLRNRHEWARLVDRGPKTNSSRKRRKLDAEESEDSEYGKDQTVKDIDRKSLTSMKEEVPKGKRNSRKRRRLALQGRGIKDVRKTHKVDNMLTDDDAIGPLSNSSEESIFSEAEIGEGEECEQGESEATASSDEAVNL